MIKEKSDIINYAITLLKGCELVYNSFESEIFPLRNQSKVLVEPEKLSLIERF